jgi:hypothetical protein
VSLVLLAILVAIWASILVPLLRRDHGNWPGRARAVAPPAAAGRGGRAVWRPEPEFLEEAEVTVPDLTVVAPLFGDAGRARPPWAERDDEEPEAGRWSRLPHPALARPGRGGNARRAVFRRRRVLAALGLATVATAVPALLLGGGWPALAAAPGLLLVAYLLALVLLARRRHGASSSVALVPAAARSLAAVPAAPE